MTDAVIHFKGSFNADGTEQVDVPLRVVDNGDGTYSLAIGGAVTAVTSPDKETPHVGFRVVQAFTGASLNETVVAVIIIDTTGVATPTLTWLNISQNASVVTPPSPIETYLQYLGGNSLTLAQLQMAGLATSAKQDTLLATQYIDVVTAQTVTTSGTSTQSSAVNASTKMIVVTATKACWILLGSNPTATSGGAGCIYLGDGQTCYPLKVTGGTTKIAVIQDTAAGKINIVESL